jgi:hypothetical protein
VRTGDRGDVGRASRLPCVAAGPVRLGLGHGGAMRPRFGGAGNERLTLGARVSKVTTSL